MKNALEKHVTVIIPCYNAEPFVGETIASVLAQTYPRVEIIVVDDGSTDGSWRVVQSFGEKITALHQANGGGCSARNAGAARARGEYLMFLDADDLLAPDALEHLVSALAGKEGIAACPWRRYEKSAEGGWERWPSGLPADPPEGDPLLGWISGWYVPPCALLWSRKAYESTGGWDEELSANQDGDLVMRALLRGTDIHFVDRGEALYRQHGTTRLSVSNNIGSVRAFHSRVKALGKVAEILKDDGQIDAYAIALGQAYHKLARNNFGTDLELARECLHASIFLAGSKSLVGSSLHKILCKLIGLEKKERLGRLISSLGPKNNFRRRYDKLHELAKK